LTPLAGKKPIRPGWQRESPLPLEAILEHVARGGNVGVRTGQISGVVGIDLDAGAEFAVTVETPTVITGSGGRHFHFAPPSVPLVNRVGAIAPHVDLRADGAQLVLPGSTHPTTGKRYAWAPGLSPEDVPLAPFPPHLLPAVTRATSAPTGRSTRPHNVTTKFVRIVAEREFDLVSNAPAGRRNHLLNVAAFNLARFIPAGLLSEATIEDTLLAAAHNCGLLADDGEVAVRATIRSGMRAGVVRTA
jgi:hypothetical protein